MPTDSSNSPRRDRLGRVLGFICLLGAGALTIPAMLYLFQDSLIFHPVPVAAAREARVAREPGVTPIEIPIEIRNAEDVVLRGWMVGEASQRALPLVLYFGGNSEEVSWLTGSLGRFTRWRIALINYRGYGRSTGAPSEAALFHDALVLYDTLAARPEVDANVVYAIGRSLGSGVAVYLASQRDLAGVALVSPYDSVRAIAKSRYPFLPVDWLLRHPFDSLERAPEVKTPALVLIAGQDRIIEPERSQRLAAAWGGPVDVVTFASADHGTIINAQGYSRALAGALRRSRLARSR